VSGWERLGLVLVIGLALLGLAVVVGSTLGSLQ